MFSSIVFFIYIFAAFAGLLAIIMAVLLLRYWSTGNKALLSSIKRFLICTALIDALYFYFDYNMLISGVHGTNAICRVIDICLFIGQVYFWHMYIVIKAYGSLSKEDTSLKYFRYNIILSLILAIICYGFLMDNYYITYPGTKQIIAIAIEIIIIFSLTAANLFSLKHAFSNIMQKKNRILIICITLLLIINGIWNGIIVIFLMMDTLTYISHSIIDPTPFFIFAINVLTISIILCEDFSALFSVQENSHNNNQSSLTTSLDYIAETHLLTEREREIMELAYLKMTNPEIAERLCISKYTVKNHMHNIFEKLDISSRSDLIMLVDKNK